MIKVAKIVVETQYDLPNTESSQRLQLIEKLIDPERCIFHHKDFDDEVVYHYSPVMPQTAANSIRVSESSEDVSPPGIDRNLERKLVRYGQEDGAAAGIRIILQ